MSEIEKLYENAELLYCNKCRHDSEIDCIYMCENKHPPFTAEKQLAIFKMFCKRYLEVSQHIEENGDLCFGIKATIGDYAVGFNKDFAECLADFVNCLWQDLTDTEKAEIKRILE